MVKEERTVVFTRDGVIVKEERETPLSKKTKTVTIDELDWDSFPIENLLIEVTGIEPVPSEQDDKAFSELKFTVSRLERNLSPKPPVKESSTDFWTHVEESTGIRKQEGEILLSGDMNAKTNLAAFVEFLLENGYLTKEDLPVKSGWKRNLINTEPTHIDGDTMEQEVIVDDGVYVETKYSRKDIKKKIEQLAEEFGQ